VSEAHTAGRGDAVGARAGGRLAGRRHDLDQVFDRLCDRVVVGRHPDRDAASLACLERPLGRVPDERLAGELGEGLVREAERLAARRNDDEGLGRSSPI